MNRIDRVRAGLMGSIVGDAFGAPVEFMKPENINHMYGKVTEMIDSKLLPLHAGEVTDDTYQILAIANGLVESNNESDIFIESTGRHFLKWKNNKRLYKDIGGTTLKSFEFAEKLGKKNKFGYPSYKDWLEAGEEASKSGHSGNGSLMRNIAVPLYFKNDIDRALRFSLYQSLMTHQTEDSILACKVHTEIIYSIMADNKEEYGLLDLISRACHPFQFKYSTTTDYLNEYSTKNGLALNTLRQILAIIDKMYSDNLEDYENILIKLVSMGYDTDTVASIAGGILGCYYGYECIPKRWLNAIDRDIINEVDGLSEKIN